MVLGTDGKLWLERAPFGAVPPARTAIDANVMTGPACGAPAIAPAANDASDTYVADGQDYAWYDDGWDGPGWYIVGYEFRRGFGFGGREGWHGWKHHGSHAHVRSAGSGRGGGHSGGAHGGSGHGPSGHRFVGVPAGHGHRYGAVHAGHGGGGGGGGGGHGGGRHR